MHLSPDREKLLVGKGGHKSVYLDPRDNSRCIKIPHDVEDVDLKREIAYRKARKLQHQESDFLPKYYGDVHTDLGRGYIFELIRDYNGELSRNLEYYLQKAEQDYLQVQGLKELVLEGLMKFAHVFLRENICVSNMEACNFLVKLKQAEGDKIENVQYYLVDNIGTHSHVPLIFFVRYIRYEHTLRYYRRFIHDLHNFYPHVVDDTVTEKLLKLR